MGIIDKELQQIKNAVYGEEMRTAIHDGLKKVSEISNVQITETLIADDDYSIDIVVNESESELGDT